MKKLVCIVVAMLFIPPGLWATTNGTVESVMFDSRVTPPVWRVPRNLQQNEKIFRAGLQMLPESLLVVGALTLGRSALGLSSGQGGNLNPLVADGYAKIHTDPAFTNVTSALPYCFASQKHKKGHYFLYRPNKLPKKPKTIVFLHGYGGNFMFYIWVLKQQFPDHVILAPSWGVSWHRGSTTYIRNMLTDAEKRLKLKLGKPWLMAISAGGRGGFIIYNQIPSDFQGYVCLASAPETAVARALRRDLKILMINGTTDRMVPIKIARKQAVLARKRVPGLTMKSVEGDHFFLLSKPKETFDAVRAFMGLFGGQNSI